MTKSYVLIDPLGNPIEVFDFQGFPDADGVTYHSQGWLTSPDTTPEMITAAGLFTIVEPASQDVDMYSTDPVFSLVRDGDHYNRVMTVQDLPLEDMKARVVSACDAKAQSIYDAGYSSSHPALAGHTLQMRNADDKGNWTLTLIECQAQIAAGNGATVNENIITTDNTVITLPCEDVAGILQAMLAWGKQIIFANAAKKAAIRAATDTATVKAIDLTTGWPT